MDILIGLILLLIFIMFLPDIILRYINKNGGIPDSDILFLEVYHHTLNIPIKFIEDVEAWKMLNVYTEVKDSTSFESLIKRYKINVGEITFNKSIYEGLEIENYNKELGKITLSYKKKFVF